MKAGHYAGNPDVCAVTKLSGVLLAMQDRNKKSHHRSNCRKSRQPFKYLSTRWCPDKEQGQHPKYRKRQSDHQIEHAGNSDCRSRRGSAETGLGQHSVLNAKADCSTSRNRVADRKRGLANHERWPVPQPRE